MIKTLALAALYLSASVLPASARVGQHEDHEIINQRSLARSRKSGGALYVMTNRVSPETGNAVIAFERNTTDGSLTRVGRFDTGGVGGLAGDREAGTPNDALAAQDTLVVSDNGRCALPWVPRVL